MLLSRRLFVSYTKINVLILIVVAKRQDEYWVRLVRFSVKVVSSAAVIMHNRR